MNRTEWALVAAGFLGFGLAGLGYALGLRWLTGGGILLAAVACIALAVLVPLAHRPCCPAPSLLAARPIATHRCVNLCASLGVRSPLDESAAKKQKRKPDVADRRPETDSLYLEWAAN